MEDEGKNGAGKRIDVSSARAGWSAKGLCIGRVYVESVHIHDAAGAFHFQQFVDATIDRTRRTRRSRTATRYLEYLPPSVPTRLLSEEAADYLANMDRRKLSSSATKSQKHWFRLLLLASGDIPVSLITCDHIREFWDVIRWWPERVGSQKKFRGMTDAEILAFGKESNRTAPAQATMELAQRQITAFFNRLLKKRVISSSPMDGFGEMKKSLVGPNTRRCFTDDEIKAIFSDSTFLPWAKKTPHAWWGPMIGLYTGARVGEVAQLKVSDVIQQHGIWCFKIHVSLDGDGGVTQSLKGESSIRIVPVAQALLDAGFLDFLEDAKASRHPRLFPQLKMGVQRFSEKGNGTSYGAALGRQFSAHLKKHHGIEKGLAFHCFRHSFITGLGINKVPTEVIASITGHSDDRKKKFPVLERHYLHLPTLEIRTEQLNAINGYKPDVVLPIYKRGQFAHCFGRHAEKYP